MYDLPDLPGAFRPRLFPIAPFGGWFQAAERPTVNSRGRQPTENDLPRFQALEGRQRFGQHTL